MQLWLRWLTISGGVATAVFVGWATHLEHNDEGMLPRLAGAFGIIAGCGTLALVVLSRLSRRFVVAPDAMVGLSQITLICPLCQKKQTLGLGKARCGECHVLIHVRVEEPKCASCGYSLLMLQSGVCPECGTRIPDGCSSEEPPAERALSI